MATLTVQSFRSITKAAIVLPQPGDVLVVAGANGAGKSSLCRAAACALLRDVAVLGRTKGDRDAQTRDGAKSGVVMLSDQLGGWQGKFPSGEMTQQGRIDDLPAASAVAAGLVRPAAMPAKDRAALLVEALRAVPTEAEWAAACAEAGIADRAAATWKEIEKAGWDAAAQAWAKDGTQAKGAWREVTGGKTWGEKAAEGWQPDGHGEDLRATSVEQARAAYLAAKAARDAALTKAATASRDQGRLDEIEAQLSDLCAQREQAFAAKEELAAKHATLKEQFDTAPRSRSTRTVCPCCNADLEIRNGVTLHRIDGKLPEAISAEKLQEETRLAYAGLCGAESRYATLSGRIETLTEERDRIAAMPERGDSGDAVEEAERALVEAEAFGKAVTATHRAADIHRDIMSWIALAGLAGPEGLRKRKLADVLKLVNGSLADLSREMGCGEIAIWPDLSITMGGRPYDLLSQSERWRVDAALAVELGRRDGSSLIVLDGADVLDAKGRSGLLSMLFETGVAALVTMTAPRSQAQKLADSGVATAWIERGEVAEIAAIGVAA